MNNLKAQVLYGGLATLVAANVALADVKIQDQNSAPYRTYSSIQSRIQFGYGIRFIEREGLFRVVNEILRPVGESNWAELLKPEDPRLMGSADSIREQYRELQQQGRIPDLGYLDRILSDLAKNMINDPLYLAGNNDFSIRILESDRQNNIILGISRDISIKGIRYNLLLNAFGSYAGEAIKINYLSLCQISSKGGLELRQIGNDFDRTYFFESLADNLVRRRKAEFYGTGLDELGFNNWTEMQKGALNQRLGKSNLRPAQIHSQ
ncbi:hypothetical protein HYX06_06180 [Candidatus Woesearchaeota archaeon]|nr:hypothetical protein [Candidatus Woesearchaeota archaeon]